MGAGTRRGDEVRGIAVVGAGSWGTALGSLLASKGLAVTIWAHEPEVARAIRERHENDAFLPGILLPEGLDATADLATAVAGKGLVVSAVPSHHVRHVFAKAAPHVAPDALVVSATKGIEEGTLATMNRVLGEVLPRAAAERLVVLSGPTFAREVAQKLPAAVVVASAREEVAREAQVVFNTPTFRTYTNSDVIGVELGGALKNVVAIACGVAAGLGLGHNTTAALITRGLAEITRLGVRMGADPLTFAGLAGLGDLVLTCTGELSRNRTVGMRLAKGEPIGDIVASMKMVAEGVRTAKSARDLARREGVEMPITDEVYSLLYEGGQARAAVSKLMTRDLKAELDDLRRP